MCKEESLAVVQKITFEILMYYKSLCEELGLDYFLAYGTLLGAVRHGGFIPWDDDVDVWMPRDDYLILLKYLREHDEGRFRLSAGEYKAPGDWPEELQMKIIDTEVLIERNYGNEMIESFPWIDIFSLDKVEDDYRTFIKEFKRKRFYYQVCRCKSLLVKSSSFYGIMNKIIYTLYNKHNMLRNVLNEKKAAYQLVDSILNEHKKADGNTYFCNAAVYIKSIEKCIFNMAWFANNKTILFSGVPFSIPTEYDKVLKTIYGDYMTLPPPEKRIGTHFGKIIKGADKT